MRVRGLSLKIDPPGGQEWRSAMIDLPFFPVSTPQAFYDLLVASARKDDPNAMPAFAAAHPEIGAFGAWAKSAPFTASYAEDRYNGLDSFVFTDGAGTDHMVRWSFVPAAAPEALTADGRADKWLVDPPREGAFALAKATADLVQGGAAWTAPARIVYVSCNPATLARDAGLLVHQAGYRCSAAGAVNMFPHTAHVESIAVFDREN